MRELWNQKSCSTRTRLQPLCTNTCTGQPMWRHSGFLSKFALLVLFKFAVLGFFLLEFPMCRSFIAHCSVSSIQLPLLVAVGSKTELQTCFRFEENMKCVSINLELAQIKTANRKHTPHILQKKGVYTWMRLYFIKRRWKHFFTFTAQLHCSPLDADDGRVPCFLQHLVPFLVISTDPVPVDKKQFVTCQPT